MRAIVLSADFDALRWYCTSAVYAGMEATPADDLHQFGSELYRDRDATGLLRIDVPGTAAGVVRELRRGDIKNRLLVLLREEGPAWLRSKRRAEALFAGADDAQPADLDAGELTARLRALSARGDYNDHAEVKLPGATFRAAGGMIECDDGRRIHLTKGESSLLTELARRPGQTRTKEQIMDALYGGVDEPGIKIVDVWVCKLRRKIEEATGGIDVVRTVWGRGWFFDPAGYRPDTHLTRSRVAR